LGVGRSGGERRRSKTKQEKFPVEKSLEDDSGFWGGRLRVMAREDHM